MFSFPPGNTDKETRCVFHPQCWFKCCPRWEAHCALIYYEEQVVWFKCVCSFKSVCVWRGFGETQQRCGQRRGRADEKEGQTLLQQIPLDLSIIFHLHDVILPGTGSQRQTVFKDLNQKNVTAPTNEFSLSLKAFVKEEKNRLQVEHVCLYLKISIRHYSHHHYPSTWAKRLPGSHDTQLMLRGGKTEYLETAGGYRGADDRKNK